jgi:hypothetical protein
MNEFVELIVASFAQGEFVMVSVPLRGNRPSAVAVACWVTPPLMMIVVLPLVSVAFHVPVFDGTCVAEMLPLSPLAQRHMDFPRPHPLRGREVSYEST